MEARIVTDKRPTFKALLKEIRFHGNKRFCQYIPTHASGIDFELRFVKWLKNNAITKEMAKVLLRLLPQIQFVDREDLLALYTASFNGPIKRWFMDQLSFDFFLAQEDLKKKLKEAIDSTWFCPITDSMDIAQFHHINGIANQDQRPPWRTLREFGDIKLIKKYMREKGFQRIVLIEDFVGTGTQAKSVLQFVEKDFCKEFPVLFLPLIISQIGVERLENQFGKVMGLYIQKLFVLPLQVHLLKEVQIFEPSIFPALRELVDETFEDVKQPFPPEKNPLRKREKFGFGETGALIVLFTNCPNNTLPIIWHNSPNWSALFPRVQRH
ncbi:hypothetical protein PJI16_03850 [Nitrospira sp. MA-1]|nr:hypothetical protein [Nitrospira sp. MA-1]